MLQSSASSYGSAATQSEHAMIDWLVAFIAAAGLVGITLLLVQVLAPLVS